MKICKELKQTKLMLGTVQFGLNYGINNKYGKPSEKEVFEILDAAWEQNIKSLDTADVYGNSIELIGQYHHQRNRRFNILSKFKDVSEGQIFEQVKDSKNKLQIECFQVYSYHSFADYINHPYLKDELQSLKYDGLIKKIGISVYTNSELEQVIEDENVDVIQLPFNLLDNQNIRGQYIDIAKKNQKEIHVRSVFLQGLLLMDEESIPQKLKSLKPYIKKLKSYCKEESINIQSLALSYAIYNQQIDYVLIGVDSKAQLLENIASIADHKNAFDFINQHIIVKEIELLNPVNWK